MQRMGLIGVILLGLLVMLENTAWAQMPMYTQGAVAQKVPGHNLVIIYPDKSPSKMDRQRRMEEARIHQAYASSRSQAGYSGVQNTNNVVINSNPTPCCYPDSFISRVYQVQTPRWHGQSSYGYTFTGPHGFYRPYGY